MRVDYFVVIVLTGLRSNQHLETMLKLVELLGFEPEAHKIRGHRGAWFVLLWSIDAANFSDEFGVAEVLLTLRHDRQSLRRALIVGVTRCQTRKKGKLAQVF